MEQERARDLLFADVTLMLGAAPAHKVAEALQRVWEDGGTLEEALELDQGRRDAVRVEVERLLGNAEGDAPTALAARGGIDRSIHTSLRPETSHAMMSDGVGARAPLRKLPEGRYEDFTLIAQGGMGAVYLAMDTELHRKVAFKMVRPDSGTGGTANKSEPSLTPLQATPPTHEDEGSRTFEELKARFLQEAWVTGALEHPGVVPVYSLGQTENGIPFYTMRYVKGERTLAEAIKRVEDLDDRLALIEAFLKVCDTIRYAHARNIIHRDLKPENVALGEFGEVVVLDWGLSKMQDQPDVSGSIWRARIAEFRDATDLRTVAGVMGTPGYMAPEAALGKSDEIDGRSDVYSLGAILYQILTGRVPFEFKTYLQYVEQVLEKTPVPAHERMPGVPEELSAACAKALAKSTEERYASVDALAEDVRRWHTEGRLAREIEDLVATARAEVKAAAGLQGNMALWHLDRASASCTRALHMRAGQPEAIGILSEIKRMREQAIGERVKSNRRQVVFAAGFVLLAAATLVTLWLVKVRSDEREAVRSDLAAAKEEAAAGRRRAGAAELDAARARRDLANGYADQARAHLERGFGAAARLAAIQGVRTAATPRTWDALARAEATWTPTLKRIVRELPARALLLSPDAGVLYSGDAQGLVRATDLKTGEVRVLGRDTDAIGVLALSPDGARLAAGGHSGRIQVWDTRTRKLVGKYPEQLSASGRLVDVGAVAKGTHVSALTFQPDGTRLFAGYLDATVRYWNLERTGVGAIDRAGTDAITALTVGPFGKYLYGGDLEGVVARWPLQGDQDMRAIATDCRHITAVTVSDDGTSFYAVGRNHRVSMVDTEDKPLMRQITVFAGSGADSPAGAFSSDRSRFFAVADDGSIQAWNPATGRLEARLQGWSGSCLALALARDDSMLAVAHGDGTVRIWDLTMGWGATATTLLLVPESARAYVARADHGIEVWDCAAGRVVRTLRGHETVITSLARDGTRLFSAGLDGALRTWDLRAGRSLRTWHKEGPAVTAVAVRPGGELVTGALDGMVHVWPAAARRPIPADSQPSGVPITAVAAAADIDRIVFGDAEGRVRVSGYDVDTGWALVGGSETRLGAAVAAVSISPDGRRLAAATADYRIHLWEVGSPTATKTHQLTAEQSLVRLVVAANGEARFWYADYRGGRTENSQVVALGADGAKPALVLGSRLPWVLQDMTRRLIGAENRFGLMLDGASVRPVPPTQYDPDPQRLEPWSK